MVHVMVFRTNMVESNIGKQDIKIKKKVPRSCQHGDYVRDSETIWRGAHTKVLHVGISGQDLTHNTQKVASEQGDGKMCDEKES